MALLAAIFAMTLCVPAQAYAYYELDPVDITLGSSDVSLKSGESAVVTVRTSPESEDQLPGCGSDYCPQKCDAFGGAGGCADPNGWCTCAGFKYQTYNVSISAQSSNSYVATASVSGNRITVKASYPGTATITVYASLRNHLTASETFDVTVTESGTIVNPAPTPDPDPAPSPDPGTNPSPSEPGDSNADGVTHAITYVLDGGVNAAANPATYVEGTSVALADPTREGYDFAGWYLDADFQNRVENIAPEAAGDVTLYAKWTVAMAEVSFSDVEEGAWYEQAVDYVAGLGLIKGYEDGTYGVGNTMTRAEFAAIMWRYDDPEAEAAYDEVMASTANTTGMADVEDGAWYTGAANWAVANGVISGVEAENGTRTFDPDGEVTFEQMMCIIANLVAPEGAVGSTNTAMLNMFSDADQIDDWARDGMCWMHCQGFYGGYDDGTVRPLENVTRERAAAILYNGFERDVLLMSCCR